MHITKVTVFVLLFLLSAVQSYTCMELKGKKYSHLIREDTPVLGEWYSPWLDETVQMALRAEDELDVAGILLSWQ